MRFANNKCLKIAIENPIGIMSSIWRKPDQIVQPWMFDNIPIRKSTCLWLKGLPKLVPINAIPPKDEKITFPSGKTMSKWYYETSCLPHSERSAIRAKTFSGIAEQMALQWSIL